MQVFGDAGSMSTSSSTLTFSPIMAWQICSHLEASPPAFWMSEVRPASLNAFSSDGRSLFSQRFEVTVSGRMTPILPVALPEAGADEAPVDEAGAEDAFDEAGAEDAFDEAGADDAGAEDDEADEAGADELLLAPPL